jgi:hypothetical protein
LKKSEKTPVAAGFSLFFLYYGLCKKAKIYTPERIQQSYKKPVENPCSLGVITLVFFAGILYNI